MLHSLRAMAILVGILLALMTYIMTQSQELSAAAALSPTSAAPKIAASTQSTVSAPAMSPHSTPGAGDDASLPQGVYVADIEVGCMRPSAAQARLAAALAPVQHSLDLRIGTARATLRPEEIGMHILLDVLIAEAQSAEAGARIALRVSYDPARLRSVLEDLARRTDQQPTVVAISDTLPFSRSFAIAAGQRLDVAMAMRQVEAHLQLLDAPPQLALLRQTDMRLPHPLPGHLQAQTAALAREWDGVVGILVSDLASGQVVAQLNEHTVLSGASVMKVAILLYAYLTHPSFTPEQEHWLDAMIIESDNLAANDLLAASAGGTTPQDAVRGARDVDAAARPGLLCQHL